MQVALFYSSILACSLGNSVAQECSVPPCFCLQGNSRLTLRCSGGEFTEVPSFPAYFQQSLTALELQNNRIVSINASDFQGLSYLREINLGSNQLNFIAAGSFSSNSALEDLYLSNNRLRKLPDNLFNSTRIFTLDLQRNNLSSLSASVFTGVPNGAIIHLDDNQLETLSQETFINLDLHELSLSGNPIRCDCLLRWFPAFRNTISATSNLGTCTQPANVAGENLEQITVDQLLCDCTPSCVNGTCNTAVGECECDDGYAGTNCDTPCPVGSFGPGCAQSCSCLSEHEVSPCNPEDGTCNCLPGYTGPSCEEVCPDGTFGTDCLEDCSCAEDRVRSPSCDNVNGECFCLPGYSGNSCEKDGGFPIFGSVLVAILCAVVLIEVIVLMVALLCAWVKRREANNKNKKKVEPGKMEQGEYYEEIGGGLKIAAEGDEVEKDGVKEEEGDLSKL